MKVIINRFVCDIAWIKVGVRGYPTQGNGFYLRHGKETCFVAKKVGIFVIMDDD